MIWQTVLMVACFASSSAIFSFADRVLYWPYLIALVGGLIVGVMEGFDQDRAVLNAEMYRELGRIRATYSEQHPQRRSFGAFFGRSLNAAMLCSVDRRFEMEQLGVAYNPLTELDWRFLCRTAIWVMALLLIPDGLGPLKPMLLWMTLWYAMVHISSVVSRVARRKIASRG